MRWKIGKGRLAPAIARIFLVSCALVSTCVLCFGQECQAADEYEFKDAVEKHGVEFSIFEGRKGGIFETIGREADQRVFEYRDNLPILDSAAIARTLASFPAGTSVLFYNYERPYLRIWVIGRHGLEGFERERVEPETILATINTFRVSLGIAALQRARTPHQRAEVAESLPNELPDQARSSAQLTELLLPRCIARSIENTRHLIVVPILAIGAVPFAALKPFGANEFLVDRMSISIAPSLFDVTPIADKWSADFRKPLVVGNPTYTRRSKWILPQLAGAQREAEKIAGMLQTTALTGDGAKKDLILKRAVDADLIYFATHGVGNTEDSRTNSFLAFGGNGNDLGFWTMKEILEDHQKLGIPRNSKPRQPFKARLAVLSACQTGLGETWKGGIMSLGRTMQVAGVPRVVMSLWNVNDDATVDLMTTFMNFLNENVPSEALQKAMIKERERHPAPADWAAFVYFGVPN